MVHTITARIHGNMNLVCSHFEYQWKVRNYRLFHFFLMSPSKYTNTLYYNRHYPF